VHLPSIKLIGGSLLRAAVGLVCLLGILAVVAVVLNDGNPLSLKGGGTSVLLTLAILTVIVLAAAVVFLQVRLSQLERARGVDNHAALHDPMTGAANRRNFELQLNQMIAEKKPAHALLMIDLDRFKPVNDLYGHAAGDALLQGISTGLARVAGANDIVARLGGDEFAMLLRQTTPKASAASALAALDFVSKYRLTWQGQRVSVGASIGIVLIDRRGLKPMDLLTAADEALYSAKEAGRGAVFAAVLAKDVSQPVTLIRIDAGTPEPVRSARSHEPLDGRRQVLLGTEMACLSSPQPSSNASSRRGSRRRHEIGFWVNAEPQTIGDAQSPGILMRELLDDASARSDGGADLARWMLIMALDAASRLTPTKISRIGIVLPIPARAVVVVPDLADELMRINALAHLPIRHLTFVLHNVAPVYDNPAIAQFHQRLKVSDVRLAFEIRASTLDVLAPLKTVPYDELHLGRELLKNVQPGTSGRAAVEAIVTVADKSGTTVVAAGVSNVDDARQLALMGVDRFYGSFAGKPDILLKILQNIANRPKKKK